VHANPTQLHQLVLNLCVNARDAMSDGGTLSVQAENVVITDPPPGVTIISNREDWIRITITDTGTGIPAKQLEEIWAPFYTTKREGHGTGLGLSTVRSLVASHGGFATVESEVGTGTTFQVHLPAVESTDSTVSDTTVDEPTIEAIRSETLLVVDDEPSMRSVIRDTLGQHGYQIILASDGVEALATLNLTQDKIDLIITDVHMPHLAGDVLVNVVKHLRPEIPILAISGHPDAVDTWKASPLTPPDAYLHKPFTGPRLVREVRTLLEQASGQPQGGDT
jgi:CheY-like chemotaxis protein